jgi:DNA invertase Pin-like site-specific DNA recombinase
MNGSNKIQETHRQRQAVVYLRQSSPKQVLENRESALNQRALCDRLAELGWKKSQIVVIDEDQGKSAKQAVSREGFQKLVAQVSLRQVGIVMGIEVSRLSRNCADWHRLLELCGLFDTLIADADGVYHPRDFNDRILLGLKGTMSEAELHSLRLRLDGGRLSKARRGELVQHLPTGYLRDTAGAAQLDPDAAVQQRIRQVFAKFFELGSSQKVLRYLVKHQLQLPRRQTSGLFAGQTLWKAPSSAALLSLLKNPAYAGAFAYGRRIVDPSRQTPERPASGRLRKPRSEWLALVKDVYPAFISWPQHESILRTIAENHRHMEERLRCGQTKRTGAAFLTGLVRCGRCGRAMQVAYKEARFQYVCISAKSRYAQATCQYLQGQGIDAAVVAEFHDALMPANIDALTKAQDRRAEHHRELVRHLQTEEQRLQYAAKRAEKQYDHVDPENRLIAATLEQRWEAALRELKTIQDRLTQLRSHCPQPVTVPPELREAFTNAGQHMPELWPQLSVDTQKKLIRTLVVGVHLRRADDTGQLLIRIVWRGGLVTEKTIRVAVSSLRHSEAEKKIVARIRALVDAGCDDQAVADQLHGEGLYPCRGSSFTPQIVLKMRCRHRIYSGPERVRRGNLDEHYTMRELGHLLGVDNSWLYRAIGDGRLEVDKHPQFRRYLFPKNTDTLTRLKQLRDDKIPHISFRREQHNG